ncbi:hypothetical protein ACHAXS_010015 [Conticribra weissflogii]
MIRIGRKFNKETNRIPVRRDKTNFVGSYELRIERSPSRSGELLYLRRICLLPCSSYYFIHVSATIGLFCLCVLSRRCYNSIKR